jgi:hypothetical protein
MSIRKWLRGNNYQDVDDKIAEAESVHKTGGSKERRNWADILSGGKDGSPLTVAGIEFPVLASAQRSRKKPVTANAIQRNENEKFPAPRVTGRWPKKKKVPAHTRIAKKATNRSHQARAS